MKRLTCLLDTMVLAVLLSSASAVYSAPPINGVQLSASISEYHDSTNYAGFMEGATDGYDAGLDLPEPPLPPAGYISLSFDRIADSPDPFGRFEEEWRALPEIPLDSARVWEFRIETDQTEGLVALEIVVGSELSSEVPVWLWDGTRYLDVRMESTLSYSAAMNPNRHFRLSIGNPDKPEVKFHDLEGEVQFAAGVDTTISWDVVTVLSIRETSVEISLDGGVNFSTLQEVDTLATSCAWSVPDSGVEAGKLKVSVIDSLGQLASNSVSFQVPDPVVNLTGVHLISPASGSALLGGETATVDWEWEGGSDNVTGVIVEVSENDGASWGIVATTSDTTSSADWIPSSTLFSRRTRLRVSALVSEGIGYADSVDQLIIRPPALQNRSFEEWNLYGNPNGPPDDWETSGAAYGSQATVIPTLTGSHVAEGSMAAQVSLASGASFSLLQEIAGAESGNGYTFSCRIYDDSPGIIANLLLAVIAENGSLLTANSSISTTNNASFIDYSVTTVAPSNAATLRLEIQFFASLSGTVYIDDVRLEGAEVNPEVTVLSPPPDTVLTWDGLTSTHIRWDYGSTAAVVKSADIEVSFDNGTTWVAIAQFDTNSVTSHEWAMLDTFSVESWVRVSAENSSGGVGSGLAGPFTLKPAVQEETLETGWHLFALPLVPEDPSVGSVLGDDFDGTPYVVTWQEGGYCRVDTLEALCGYWLALDESAVVDIVGEALLQDAERQLDVGWSLVLNPYPRNLELAKLRFRVSEVEKEFAEAVDAGWVSSELQGYDNSTGNYFSVDEGAMLKPFVAYWIASYVEGVTMIASPPRAGSSTSSSFPGITSRELADSSWTATIVLRSNLNIDRRTEIGFVEGGTSGLDPWLDIPAPPDDPEGLMPRLMIRALDQTLASGSWLRKDIRDYLEPGDREEWTLKLRPRDQQRIDIDFLELVTSLPGGFNAGLVLAGESLDLQSEPLIQWSANTHPDSMVLFIAADAIEIPEVALPVSFEITRVWPNPFNSVVTLQIALPAGETVTVEAVDVTGRLVELIDTAFYSSGWHYITWKPNSASGFYFLRVRTSSGLTDVQKVLFLK